MITASEAIDHQPSLHGAKPRPSLFGALLAGAVAAAIGAAVWGAITAFTGYQIGYMAIGVGFLVGIAVRMFGRGRQITFGLVGAIFAGLGCAAGNLFAGCIMLAKAQEIGIGEMLSLLDLDLASEIMGLMFSPMDLLFYGFAIWTGFKLSVIEDEQAASAANSATESAPDAAQAAALGASPGMSGERSASE